MTRLRQGFVLGAATLSWLAACGDDSSTGSNGGSGGSQAGSAGTGGAGGAQGGSAGSGGSGGVAGADGSSGDGGSAGSAGSGGAGAARFQVSVVSDALVLTALDPVWMLECENSIQGIRRVDGSWTLLRDERPEAFGGHHAAHYLDGSFHADCNLSLGCDVAFCSPLASDPGAVRQDLRPSTREYVQVGQARALTCSAQDAGLDAGPLEIQPLDAGPLDAGTGGRLVPALEARTATGPFGVRVRYFTSSNCSGDPLSADVAVD